MGAGVISVGGVKYAAGLYWQPSAQKNVAAAAREAAREGGVAVDYFAERPADGSGRVGQFGLASREAGHRPGLPSIAASLANAQVGSWAGAFRVPEGVVVCVVRDDLIDPEGDQLYADEAEGMARLDEEVARGGLQRLFAPISWGLPGSDEISLPLLLGKRRDGRLKPIKSKAPIYAGAAAAALLLFLGGSWVYGQVMNYMDQQAATARAEQRLATADAAWATSLTALQQERDGIAMPPPAVDYTQTFDAGDPQLPQGDTWPPARKVWQDQMGGMDFLLACKNMLAAVPAAVLGWDMVSVRCAPVEPIDSRDLNPEAQAVTLNVLWDRRGGRGVPPPTVTFDQPGARQIFAQMQLTSSVQESLQTASSYINSNGLPARGEEELWDEDRLTQYALAEGWPDGALTREPDDPPYIPPAKRDTDEVPPRPDWQKRGVSFDTVNPPWTMQKTLEPVPGLVFQSLDWEPGSNWRVRGAIYENR